MEKLQLNFNEIDENKILKELKENKVAKDLIDRLNLKDEVIIQSYDLILNYIRESSFCDSSCTSKDTCIKKSKMYRYDLYVDENNNLQERMIICPYYKDYYKRKKNLIYTTFDEDVILDDKSKDFIIDNINIFGNVKKLTNILTHNKETNGIYFQLKDSVTRLNLVKSLAYRLLGNEEVAIVKFQDMLMDIKEEFKLVSDDKIIDKVNRVSILIIDGIGHESITNWSRDEILYSLLDNRIQNKKTTILCSEYTIDELKSAYRIKGNQDALKVEKLIDKIKEIDK